MNLILIGPCGAGKSVIGKSLANHAKLRYLDFDALGITDIEDAREAYRRSQEQG